MAKRLTVSSDPEHDQSQKEYSHENRTHEGRIKAQGACAPWPAVPHVANRNSLSGCMGMDNARIAGLMSCPAAMARFVRTGCDRPIFGAASERMGVVLGMDWMAKNGGCGETPRLDHRCAVRGLPDKSQAL